MTRYYVSPISGRIIKSTGRTFKILKEKGYFIDKHKCFYNIKSAERCLSRLMKLYPNLTYFPSSFTTIPKTYKKQGPARAFIPDKSLQNAIGYVDKKGKIKQIKPMPLRDSHVVVKDPYNAIERDINKAPIATASENVQIQTQLSNDEPIIDRKEIAVVYNPIQNDFIPIKGEVSTRTQKEVLSTVNQELIPLKLPPIKKDSNISGVIMDKNKVKGIVTTKNEIQLLNELLDELNQASNINLTPTKTTKQNKTMTTSKPTQTKPQTQTEASIPPTKTMTTQTETETMATETSKPTKTMTTQTEELKPSKTQTEELKPSKTQTETEASKPTKTTEELKPSKTIPTKTMTTQTKPNKQMTTQIETETTQTKPNKLISTQTKPTQTMTTQAEPTLKLPRLKLRPQDFKQVQLQPKTPVLEKEKIPIVLNPEQINTKPTILSVEESAKVVKELEEHDCKYYDLIWDPIYKKCKKWPKDMYMLINEHDGKIMGYINL